MYRYIIIVVIIIISIIIIVTVVAVVVVVVTHSMHWQARGLGSRRWAPSAGWFQRARGYEKRGTKLGRGCCSPPQPQTMKSSAP